MQQKRHMGNPPSLLGGEVHQCGAQEADSGSPFEDTLLASQAAPRRLNEAWVFPGMRIQVYFIDEEMPGRGIAKAVMLLKPVPKQWGVIVFFT